MQVFHFDRYFPETMRAFAHGETSLLMDRYGGILELSHIDTLHRPEHDYPDNHSLPLLSRNAMLAVGRPLCGPAIQMLSEDKDGKVDYHEPYSPVVYPWAVVGGRAKRTFGMVIDGDRIVFACSNKNEDRRKYRMVLSKLHFCNGNFGTRKNQRVGDGCEQICEALGVSFDENLPFPNGQVACKWSGPTLVADQNVLVWRCEQVYPYGSQELYLALACSKSIIIEQTPTVYALTSNWENDFEIQNVMAIDCSRDQAIQQALTAVGHFQSILDEKCRKISKLEKSTSVVSVDGDERCAQFSRGAAGYIDSLLLHNTAGIRAAQHKFAEFMMWDTLYPVRDLLWMGQYGKAKALFKSFIGYPYIDKSAWIVSQLFLVLEEILSFDEDDEFLEQVWPFVCECLEVQLQLTDKTTGLVASSMTSGVDVPQELGLSGLYNAPCINAWWYGGLRSMENIARRRHEMDLTETLQGISEKIEKSYLKGFLDSTNGYLRSGIHTDLTPGAVEAFQNTSTIGIDYPFGRYLLREAVPALAAYQRRKLRHPVGYTAVSWDTAISCEMWKNVHMNQHLAHEGLLQRLTGNMPEAWRLLNGYMDFFDVYKTAIETINYSGCLGNETQTADWQAFSSTAVCEMLRSTIAGIGRHRGGLFYEPADDSHTVTVESITWKTRKIVATVCGRGDYISPIVVNGKKIPGTAQLPSDLPNGGTITWEIHRSRRCPAYPVLVNTFGLPVSDIMVSRDDCLAFTCKGDGRYPMEFIAPEEARVLQNGVEIPHTCCNKRLYVDCLVTEGDAITVLAGRTK